MNGYKVQAKPARGGWEPAKWIVAVKAIDHDAEVVELDDNVWEVQSAADLAPALTKRNGVVSVEVQ